MRLLLLYMVLASIPDSTDSQGVSVVIWKNTTRLFCQNESELNWQLTATSNSPSTKCVKSGTVGRISCTCVECQSFEEMKMQQFLQTALPCDHTGLTGRVMDCLNRFNGPLETGQSLSQMAMDKWYRVDTLEIDQNTREEDLRLAVRIVDISGGLTISGSGIKNLTLLAQILQSRNLKISGNLTVVDNPELDNIDDLLLRGYDSIEIRNNPKLTIGWETIKIIKEQYVTYSQYQDNEEFAADFERFHYDFLNHKCPAPDVLNGELLSMTGDCYVLEGDVQLSDLKENDQHYDLEKLEKVLYVKGSVTFNNDQTKSNRLASLVNLMSIDNEKEKEPALVVQNVSNPILDLSKDLFEVKCDNEPCVQLDKKVYESDNENSWKILLHAVGEKKNMLGLVAEKTVNITSSGQKTSNKRTSIVIGLSIWTAIFLLAVLTVLFLSNCIFEWPKPMTERRKDGKMPIQRIFAKLKKQEKTAIKSEKMEKTDPEGGQKATPELPKSITGKMSQKEEPAKKKSVQLKAEEPKSKPAKSKQKN